MPRSPLLPMRTLLSALLLACLTSVACAGGPIRVLFLGKEGTASSKHCPVLMRELGRESIWFDYMADPKQVTSDYLKHFDAVLLDAPREGFPTLSEVEPARILTESFVGEEREWGAASFIKGVSDRILTAVGPARKADWEKFVAQREPEVR